MKRVPHPSGVDILFDNKWHQYKIHHTALRSVSKLLDKHFPFDEKRALAAVSLKTGQSIEAVKASWTRQALLGKNIHEYIENKLRGTPPPTWTILLKQQEQLKKKQQEEEENNKKTKTNNKKKKKSKNSEEEEEKEENKIISSPKQSIADAMLHGEEAAYMLVADKVVETIKTNYDIISLEQIIASPSWGIGGTVDIIARNKKTKKILIGDWKTSGSVISAFRFGSYETPCTGCLMHLPNSKFYRYAMQVIVYGEILKHENYLNSGFFGQKVHPVNKEIKEIILGSHETHGELEYGIVQLSKNEEGGVSAEFKNVTEATVLPVDATDLTFIELLKTVMRG